MADGGPRQPEARLDPITERAARSYLEGRIRELEAQVAALEASRDLHRGRADAYRFRVELAHARMASMSRVARMWLLVRTSLLHPRKLVRMPLELARIALRWAPPESVEPLPWATEESVDRLETVAAEERRGRVISTVRDRFVAATAPRPVESLRVALVADDPLRAAVDGECRVIALTPDRWRDQLDAERPDLLLVESARRGIGGAWQHRIGWEAHPLAIGLDDLRALLEDCAERGVPTCFWDMAGSRSWDRYRPAALLFDQLFSVDPAVLERAGRLAARRFAGLDVLAPAAQPRIHHPIRGLDEQGSVDGEGTSDGRRSADGRRSPGERGSPDDRPAYLGTVDPRLPLARREALEGLLDAARPFGLAIHDPEAGSAPGSFALPERFREHLARRPSEADVPALLRRQPLFLLAGHDPDAIGDLPGRLPALLAAGRTVLATPSRAIEAFAGAAVRQVDGPDEAAAAIAELLGSAQARRRIRLEVVPRIVAEHSIRLRLATIARSVGLAVDARPAGIGLLVLADEREGDRSLGLVEAVVGQSRPPDEIVIGSQDADSHGRELALSLGRSLDGVPVRIVAQDEGPSGERIRRLAAVASSEWLAIVDDRHRYGPGHLAGLAAICGGPPADLVGVARHATLDGRIVEGPEDSVARAVHPGAALVRRQILLERGWPDGPSDAVARFGEWAASGARIVAVASDDFVADPSLALRVSEGAAA
jgi:hypothetical protein